MYDLNEVALASLLRHTGKFLRSGAAKTTFDEKFLEKLEYSETVREAALDDGGSEARSPATHAVRAAEDILGSGGDTGFDPSAPLKPILDFVGLGKARESESRRSCPVGEYGGPEISPYMPRSYEESEAEAHRRLADGLARGFERLRNPTDADSVLSLLERYGSHVRFPRPGGGEVSLFDGSRAAAALSVCIAAASSGEDVRFLFVRGDLSGVQKFIYTITSKGALRMLRARSFFLELVAEHALSELLRLSGVPRTNVIFAGGGGFQILLPNTEKSSKAVETVRREMNGNLSSGFGHELFLALAKAPCDAAGITGDGLGETLRTLGRDLSEQKARKYSESLHGLFNDRAEPGLESCDVCTRDELPVETVHRMDDGEEAEERRMCGSCATLDRASSKLVGRGYLVADGGGDFGIGGKGYTLSGDSRNALYALEGVGDEACLSGAVPFPAARHAARKDGRIADFDTLAQRAEGASRLAVLRMDVDDLGEIFRSGLPREMRTFDRYAALSRAFTTFFKMIVPRICEGGYENSLRLFSEEGEGRAATIVYSGGDDLFIVGAWSDVLELAVDVRRAFREFVCGNPSVTLSAGISIHKPGEPLYLMAEHAGEAEKTAKNNKRNGRKKDSVVLFHRGPDIKEPPHPTPEALFWEEVEGGVVDLVKRISEFRGADGKLAFPRGFTRMLMDVVDVYEREGHLSLPRLAYALTRMEEGAKLAGDGRWLALKRELLKIEVVEKRLRPAAYWLDLAERSGDGKK